MNKKNLKIFLALLVFAVFGGQALAATDVIYIPVSANAVEGRIFPLSLFLNPAGADNYTAKLEINFPSDLLQVQSFSFGQNWLPIVQPGYDLTDNQNGVLLKTAGYPGGFKEIKSFGTVNFLAKKGGQGVIRISGNSFVLDAQNANVLRSPLSSVAFNISAPVATPVATPKPTQTATPTQQPVAEEQKLAKKELAESVPAEPSVPENGGEQRELALADAAESGLSAASLVSLGTGKVLLGAALWTVIALLIGFGVFYLMRKIKASKTQS